MTVLLPQFDQNELDEAHAELMGYLQVLKMRICDENLARNEEAAVEEDRARRANFEFWNGGMRSSRDIEEPWITRDQYVRYNAKNGVKNGVLDVENGDTGDIGTKTQDVGYSAKNEDKYDNVGVNNGEYSVEDERGSNTRPSTSSEVHGDTHLLLSNGFSSLHSLRMKTSNTLHALWR